MELYYHHCLMNSDDAAGKRDGSMELDNWCSGPVTGEASVHACMRCSCSGWGPCALARCARQWDVHSARRSLCSRRLARTDGPGAATSSPRTAALRRTARLPPGLGISKSKSHTSTLPPLPSPAAALPCPRSSHLPSQPAGFCFATFLFQPPVLWLTLFGRVICTQLYVGFSLLTTTRPAYIC